MSIRRPAIRLVTVCTGIAGAGLAMAAPAVAADPAPASIGAPVETGLNTSGVPGSSTQSKGQPAGLPVAGGLLGGLPTGGLPLGG